jgi:DNA-directed RNA polymerase specialized sigma24 family protein
MREVQMDESALSELLRYARALVAIQIRALSKEEVKEKPEILLARAGLPVKEIAELLGKNPDAVKKAIQRAGKKEA